MNIIIVASKWTLTTLMVGGGGGPGGGGGGGGIGISALCWQRSRWACDRRAHRLGWCDTRTPAKQTRSRASLWRSASAPFSKILWYVDYRPRWRNLLLQTGGAQVSVRRILMKWFHNYWHYKSHDAVQQLQQQSRHTKSALSERINSQNVSSFLRSLRWTYFRNEYNQFKTTLMRGQIQIVKSNH